MNKVRCPICKAEMPGSIAECPTYPFCSVRCRKIDLGNWLSENYRIPDADARPQEDEAEDDEG